MCITRPNTLIPYFTANLMHYFYYLRSTHDSHKPIADLKSTSKNTSTKIVIRNK